MHQQHKLFAVSLIITIMAINIHNHPSKNTDMFTQEGGGSFQNWHYCLQYLYAMTFLRKKIPHSLLKPSKPLAD